MMEEIKQKQTVRLPALPKRRTPFLADAAAFAALGLGGYAALRLVDLLFRAIGVG